MICLYWSIGRAILEKQEKEGWGAKVIDRMSKDLKSAFPEMSGFSPRNIKYMRKFAQCWLDYEIVQQVVAQIPQRTNITLIELVCKKIIKGKTIPVIADELEQEESVIEPIYHAALQCAPEYDYEKIYQLLKDGQEQERQLNAVHGHTAAENSEKKEG